MESNWELNHVGLVVRDWNKTLDYYQSIGCIRGIGSSVGPQPVYLDLVGGGPLTSFSQPIGTRRRPRRLYRFAEKDCQIGSLLLELIQPRGAQVANDPNKQFLGSKGEGITHICFNVPDPKGETAKLVEKGCQVIFSIEQDGIIIENYIDTRKFGNIILSLRCPMRKWEKAWKAHNMTHPFLRNWNFSGVGVAVRDMDRAVEYYQSLGIATFQPEVMFDSSSFEDIKLYGKTPDPVAKARTRIAQIGPVGYEFVQPLEGESIYKESLESRGECINDIAFTVDDLERETARLVERGEFVPTEQVPVILSGKPQSGSAFAYFDTRKFGSIMVKLIQAE